MNLDFEKLFKITTTALRLLGLHPDLKRGKLWLLRILLLQGFVTSMFSLYMYNLLCYDIKYNNFTHTCHDGVVIIVILLSTCQYFMLVFNKESLLTLIKNMKNDYETSSSLIQEEQMVIKNYADKGLYVCKQWLVIDILGTLTYVLKSIFLTFYYYYYNGEFQLVQIYDFFYPELIDRYTDNLFGFFFKYAYALTFSLYSSVMYTAYCPLGPIFMLHACSQLEIVKMRLDNLFVELEDKVIKEKFVLIIERLQYTYNFVKIVNNIFKIPYEMTLKAATIALPVAFYEVIEAVKRGELPIHFISYILGSILISSAPCYFSDVLKEKCEEVRQAIYASGWEAQYVRSTRSTILILLMNTQRPIAIRTVFKTLCLETLTDVFQQSYTIFNLMNAMWK